MFSISSVSYELLNLFWSSFKNLNGILLPTDSGATVKYIIPDSET